MKRYIRPIKLVPVFDENGKILAQVRQNCTSIGASKAAAVQRCEWSRRFGEWGWIVKGKM